jgi:hypothetical protein
MTRRRPRSKPSPEKYTLLWTILADTGLSSTAKCTAVALLLKFRNDKPPHKCNPGFGTLSAVIGRSRRVTIEAVKELATRGWIKVHSTSGGSPSNTNKITFCKDLDKPVSSSHRCQRQHRCQITSKGC